MLGFLFFSCQKFPVEGTVADVFGPPGPGSNSTTVGSDQAKIEKNLDFYGTVFCDFFRTFYF